MALMQEVKSKRRSLREILPAAATGGIIKLVKPPEVPVYIGRTNVWWRRRPVWITLLVLALLLLGFFLPLAWAQVTLEITPISSTVALAEKLVATNAGPSLVFSLVTLPAKVGTRLIKATGTERVSRSASGQIVIYNNYDQKTQKLVANTRFQAENGKVYRIHNSVTVPGTKVVAGKVVPGSIEATVFADEPGPAYNGEATDFTIPGLKNDPRFDKFFARSKTALTGGIIGEVPKLSDAEEKKARSELETGLTADLLKDARFQIPVSEILFDRLVQIDFQDVTDWQAATTNGQFLIKESASLRGILLPRRILIEKLAAGRMADFSPAELDLSNLDNLDISLDSPLSTGINLTELKTLNLQVSGTAQLVSRIDQASLTTKLIGIRASEVDNVLAKVKGVAKVRVILNPPWLRHLPQNPENIKILVLHQSSID